MFIVEVWSRDPLCEQPLIRTHTRFAAGTARMLANHAAKQGHWVNLIHPTGRCEGVS